jgi:hypothetical protein
MSTSSLSTGVHLLTIVLDDGTRREESIGVNAFAPPPLTLSAAILRTGQPETVTGTGYAPGTLVTVRLDGVVVGTATASAGGTFTLTMTIPPTAPLGMCTFSAEGVRPNGSRWVETTAVIVTG